MRTWMMALPLAFALACSGDKATDSAATADGTGGTGSDGTTADGGDGTSGFDGADGTDGTAETYAWEGDHAVVLTLTAPGGMEICSTEGTLNIDGAGAGSFETMCDISPPDAEEPANVTIAFSLQVDDTAADESSVTGTATFTPPEGAPDDPSTTDLAGTVGDAIDLSFSFTGLGPDGAGSFIASVKD